VLIVAKNRGQIGPYSRRLRRGAIGGLIEIDGRSAEGRFIRHLEAELTAHVGGDPTIVQRLLIERLIKIRCQLDRLDEKLATGGWTDHDSRTYGGLLNAYRLTARELGLKPAAAKVPSLEEVLRQGRAAEAAA
jgi:hypothetical protein